MHKQPCCKIALKIQILNGCGAVKSCSVFPQVLSLSQVEVRVQTCALDIPSYQGITEAESKAVAESSSSKSIQCLCLEGGGDQ